MSSICSDEIVSRRQDLVQFVVGDVAALLGELDHPLDGGIGQVEERPVGRLLGWAASVSSRSVAFVAMISLLFRTRRAAEAVRGRPRRRRRECRSASDRSGSAREPPVLTCIKPTA